MSDSSNKRHNLAYVSIHPAPYRDEFLKRLYADGRLETKVYNIFENDAGHRFWNLDAPEYNPIQLCSYSMTRWQICRLLVKTFVFSTYNHICWPGFLDWYQKVPLIIFALTGRHYSLSVDTVSQRRISGLAYKVKRWLVRKADFIFVPGEASVRFFEKEFDMPRARLVKGSYALDGVELERKVLAMRELETGGTSVRNRVRAKLGLKNEDVVYLMVANMIPTRHYPITSAAFVKFAEEHPNTRFVMVGKGPDTVEMQHLAEKHDCLRVIPGCSFEEMMGLYAAADIYVHGGTEPASTALVIGSISHLPIIASPAVGCYYDVMEDGVTGYAVDDYLDASKWADAFARSLRDRTRWPELGKNGREKSKALDIGPVLESFIAAVSKAIR